MRASPRKSERGTLPRLTKAEAPCCLVPFSRPRTLQPKQPCTDLPPHRLEEKIRPQKAPGTVFPVTDLERSNGQVSGVLGIDERSDAPFRVEAEHVVIAAGGICGDIERLNQHWYPDWDEPPETILNGSHRYADGGVGAATASAPRPAKSCATCRPTMPVAPMMSSGNGVLMAETSSCRVLLSARPGSAPKTAASGRGIGILHSAFSRSGDQSSTRP